MRRNEAHGAAVPAVQVPITQDEVPRPPRPLEPFLVAAVIVQVDIAAGSQAEPRVQSPQTVATTVNSRGTALQPLALLLLSTACAQTLYVPAASAVAGV